MRAGILRLSVRYLVSRWGRMALVAVVVATAALLVTAFVSVQASFDRSIAQFYRSIGGAADLQVVGLGDSGFPVALADRIAATRGVAASTDVVDAQVDAGRRQLPLVGVEASAAAFVSGSGGDVLRTAVELARPSSLLAGPRTPFAVDGAGHEVTVYARGARHRVPVTGVIPASDRYLAAFSGGDFLAAPLPYAQLLAGETGRVNSELIRVARGVPVARVSAAIGAELRGGQAVIESPAQSAHLAAAGVSFVLAGLPLVAGAVAVVAMFLVLNAMGILAEERRKEMAVLRALGARRGQLVSSFLLVSLLVGAVASAAGVVAGLVLARSLVAAFPPILLSSISIPIRFATSPWAVGAGLVTGVGGAVAASWLPARRAGGTAPVEAMRDRTAELAGTDSLPVRWAAVGAGIAACGAGVAAGLLRSSAAGAAGTGLVVLGAVAVAFGAAGPIVRLSSLLARRAGIVGRIAGNAMEHAPRQAWTTILAVVAATTLVVGVGEVASSGASSVTGTLQPLGRVPIWVQTAPADSLPNHVLMPDGWAARLRAIPGVGRVVAGQISYVNVGGSQIMVEATGPGSRSTLVAAAGPAARRAVDAGRGAIVSTQFARARHLSVGSSFVLPTPAGGGRHLRVAAVVTSFAWPQGSIDLGMVQAERWYDRYGSSWFEVGVAPHRSVAAVVRRIRGALASSPFPVYVTTGSTELAASVQAIDQLQALLYGLDAVAIAVAAIALLTTLAVLTLQSRKAFGILRSVGMVRTGVVRYVLTQALSIAGVAAIVGLPLGLLVDWQVTRVAASDEGIPLHFEVAAVPLVVAAGGALLMAGVGGWWPARRAAAAEIAAAIGYE